MRKSKRTHQLLLESQSEGLRFRNRRLKSFWYLYVLPWYATLLGLVHDLSMKM